MQSPDQLVAPKRDFIDRILVAGAVVVFLFLPFSEALTGMSQTVWTAAAFALIGGAILFGRAVKPANWQMWVVAAYLAFLGVISSSGNADNFRAHLLMGLQVIFYIALAPYALRHLSSVDGLVRKVAAAFLLGQSISAVAAIAQASGISVLGVRAAIGRSPGLAGHTNMLGLLSGIAVVVFLYLIFTSSRRKLVNITGFLLNVAALLASGSVSALIACVIGVAILMAAARVSARGPLIIAVGGWAALWILGQLADAGMVRGPLERIAQVTGQTNEKSTLDIRQHTYAYAWEHIQRDPFFGAGLDYASGVTFDYTTLTHNILLRTWFQGGLFMGAGFALMCTLISVVVLRSVAKGVNAAPAGVLAVIIGFSMTSAALQQGYFWLLIFGAWALVEPPEKAEKVDRQLEKYLSLRQAQTAKP